MTAEEIHAIGRAVNQQTITDLAGAVDREIRKLELLIDGLQSQSNDAKSRLARLKETKAKLHVMCWAQVDVETVAGLTPDPPAPLPNQAIVFAPLPDGPREPTDETEVPF